MERKSFEFETRAVSDDGTFTGYLAVFGNIDAYGDRIIAGSFKKSLATFRKKKRTIPVLWQHRSDQPIGGLTEAVEDDAGLLVTGQLLTGKVQQATEAHALMTARILSGMSIGFDTVKDRTDADGVRELLEIDLWEGSIVTFPANDLALISAVKSALDAGKLPTLREFERLLREQGFSRTQATAIAGGGLRKMLLGEPEAEANALADILSAITTTKA